VSQVRRGRAKPREAQPRRSVPSNLVAAVAAGLSRLKARAVQAIEGRVLYAGNRFSCPCCGGSFRKLKPHGARPNASCPGCGSLERHRLLWLYLTERRDLFRQGTTVLHFAPEPALREALSSMRGVRYTGADLIPGPDVVQLDITAIELEDASVDIVLCNHVLEHVADDRKAMRELWRVLRQGGRAIMQHPVDYGRAETYEDWSIVSSEGRLRAFGQEDHVRVYGRDFKHRLEEAGFRVQIDRYLDRVDEKRIERHALRARVDTGSLRAEDVYVCTKDPSLAGARRGE
jgi:SAM-dependent methyltransferase